MHIVPIAWMFVVVLMALAEATSTQGTLLGAFFTFVLYGLLPMAIVAYILGTPGRKRALQARREAEQQAWLAAQGSSDPDAGGKAPTTAEDGVVAPVRKEP